jgi:hypothetical protein
MSERILLDIFYYEQHLQQVEAANIAFRKKIIDNGN